MSLTDKEKELLTQIHKKVSVLKTAAPVSLKKKEFIREAVAVNPKAIKYADPELLCNAKFIENLVKNNGMVAAYIPSKYNSPELFLIAIENTLDVVPFIHKSIYKEMSDGAGIQIEEPYIICRGLCWAYAYNRPNLVNNKNLAIFFAKHFFTGFSQVVASKYKDDKDVALAAVRTSVHNFYRLDKSLQNDMDVIKCAYRKDPTKFVKQEKIVEWAPDEVNLLAPYRSAVVADREFILDCLINDGIDILEPEYADDMEIATLAITNAHVRANTPGFWQDNRKRNLSMISDRLKDNKDFIMLVTLVEHSAISYASDRIKEDKDYILDLIEYLSAKNEFVFLRYLSESMQDDEEVVAACAMESAEEFKYASDRLLYNVDFALTLMMNMNIDVYDMLPDEVKESKAVREYIKRESLREKYF